MLEDWYDRSRLLGSPLRSDSKQPAKEVRSVNRHRTRLSGSTRVTSGPPCTFSSHIVSLARNVRRSGMRGSHREFSVLSDKKCGMRDKDILSPTKDTVNARKRTSGVFTKRKHLFFHAFEETSSRLGVGKPTGASVLQILSRWNVTENARWDGITCKNIHTGDQDIRSRSRMASRRSWTPVSIYRVPRNVDTKSW